MANYRYRITRDNDDQFGFIPYAGEDQSIKRTRIEDTVIFRTELTERFKLIGSIGDYVINSDISARFEVEVQVQLEEFGAWTAAFSGEFWKTDCDIDEDGSRVDVQLLIFDQYDKILSGLGKEFDLLQLLQRRSTLHVDIIPQIQYYQMGNDFVYNIDGTTSSEIPSLVITDQAEMTDTYFFTFVRTYAFIPIDVAAAIDTPGVAGLYQSVTGVLYEQPTGLYELFRDLVSNPGSERWQIREKATPTNIIYQGPIVVVPGATFFPQGPRETLDSTTTADQVEFYLHTIYSRMLTAVDYLAIGETRPATDIVPFSDDYPFIHKVGLNTLHFAQDVDSTTDVYGRRDFPRLNIADNQEYFHLVTPVSIDDQLYALNSSSWFAFAKWVYIDDTQRTLQESATLVRVIKDSYTLRDVVSTLLLAIDPDITFLATEEYSKFYYATENPISGDQKEYIFVPKSNFLIGEYTQPATTALVKLGELLDDLWEVHRVRWDLTTDKKFILEHIRHWHNGKDYVTPNVGINIADFNDPYTETPWGEDQNKYTYSIGSMPRRIDSKWLDQVSSYGFIGFPIDATDRYIDEEGVSTETKRIVSTDLSYAFQNPDKTIQDKGLFMCSCVSIAANVYEVSYRILTIDGVQFQLLNGDLSFPYLHTTFFRDRMSSINVVINNEVTTALSAIRTKVQEVVFASTDVIDPQALIESQLGVGEITEITEDLTGTKKNIFILHDTL